MPVRVEMNDAAFRGRLVAAVRAAAERTGEHLVAEIQDRIDTPYPPASLPGEPPHRRTGNLHGSIRAVSDEGGGGVSVHVGTAVVYGGHLERGEGVKQRPYLASTLAETAPLLGEIFADTLRAELASV
jgi:hypothetical protein